jgi:hypothetical protein
MAKQINPSRYIAVLRQIITAMAIPKADREAILGGLKRYANHVKHERQYAARPPRTPEQRAKASMATRRWRERKAAAATVAASAISA